MLGRPYTFCGRVIPGSGVGRQMGVPTANLDAAGLLAPPSGVYAARAFVGPRSHPAAVNIGFRPTLDSAAPPARVEEQGRRRGSATPPASGAAPIQVEAHLLDFAGDIYGEEVELAFLKKLRNEQKFPSLAALREQIQRDIARVRELSGDF